jgi:transposase-like protein
MVARQYGVNPNQLLNWRKLYQDRSLPAVKGGEEVGTNRLDTARDRKMASFIAP